MSLHIPHRAAGRRACLGAALLALAAAGPAAAAVHGPLINLATASKAPPPAAGTVYGGNTAQDAPFGVRMKRSGREVSQLLLHFRANCDDGTPLTWAGVADFADFLPPTVAPGENVFAPAKLSRTGGFKASGLAVSGFGGNVAGRIEESIRGKLRGATAHGTFEATVELFDITNGNPLGSCRTGSLRWAAKSAPGRMYAGLTSANGPVVVELAANRRRVSHFRVSWGADCQPEGGYFIGDHLTGLPVSLAGRFGDTFSQEFSPGEGRKIDFAYVLDGSAGRTKASGTLQVKMTETDAAGALTHSCDSTLLSWSAAASRGPSPRAAKPKRREIRVER